MVYNLVSKHLMWSWEYVCTRVGLEHLVVPLANIRLEANFGPSGYLPNKGFLKIKVGLLWL
jgi:hypothetical protein